MCCRERRGVWRGGVAKDEERGGEGSAGRGKEGEGKTARPVLDQEVVYFMYCLKQVLCFRCSSSSDPEDAV